MTYVIRILGIVGKEEMLSDTFMQAFDHEAHDGRGSITLTKQRDHAMTFETTVEAWEFWRKVSAIKPTRPDGKPNRPFTAYSVHIEPKEGYEKVER